MAALDRCLAIGATDLSEPYDLTARHGSMTGARRRGGAGGRDRPPDGFETVDDEHVEALMAAGFDREAVWDVASVTAFFNLSNRMSMVADIRPNDAFYDLSPAGSAHADG